MKKSLGGMATFFLFLVAILYIERLHKNNMGVATKSPKQTILLEEPTKTNQNPLAKLSESDEEVKKMHHIVYKESRLVGKVDSQPQKTLERLQGLAQELSKRQMKTLETIALSRDRSGDERYMSVFLLSLHSSALKVEALTNIASNPLPEYSGVSRLRDDEVMVRMQAIEGIKTLDKKFRQKSLSKILRHQESVFLSRFAKQSLQL